MSEQRVLTHKLIDEIPEDKITYIYKILFDIKEAIDDIDDLDLKLLEEAKFEMQEGEFIPFKQAVAEMGINYDKL